LRHGTRDLRAIIEERVWPGQSAHPPAHNLCCTADKNAKRWRRRRVRRKRPDGRALVNAAQRWAEQLIAGPSVRRAIYDRMNERDDRESWVGGGASDRGAATISVPAQDFAGEPQAAQSVGACRERHLTRRHLKNVRATGSVENVRSFEEARKCLAVLAVADEAEAGGRRNRAGDSAQTITMASQRDVCHLAFSIGCRGSSECAASSK